MLWTKVAWALEGFRSLEAFSSTIFASTITLITSLATKVIFVTNCGEMCLLVRSARHLPLGCWWLIWPIQNDAKNPEKWQKPWQMGTHLKVLSESYQMNTNMTWFRGFPKIFVLWRKVASALKGLTLERFVYWTDQVHTIHQIKSNIYLLPYFI